jgi:hypothetical protein
VTFNRDCARGPHALTCEVGGETVTRAQLVARPAQDDLHALEHHHAVELKRQREVLLDGSSSHGPTS